MKKIGSFKVTTLADNLVGTDTLGEWGLCFLLEVEDAEGKSHKVVSDTGMTKEAILHNIKRLKLDLSDLELIFLSHGHLDHTATTVEIIKLAGGGVKVVSHPYVFLQRFHIDKKGKRTALGVPEGEGEAEIESAGGEILQSKEPLEILPGLWTTGQVPRKMDFEVPLPPSPRERLEIVVEGEPIPDQILDDQALWMDVANVGPMVITACAHSGVINTLLQVEHLGGFKAIHGLTGGTYLVGRSEEYLQRTIEELRKFNIRLLAPCHCTGFKAMSRLYQASQKASPSTTVDAS